MKGARICSQDNRTLKLDLFSKGRQKKKKGVLISATLGTEGEAQNLVSVTIAEDCKSRDVV